MTEYEMILRLVLALILGALIGIERVHAGKSAGVRTLGLVALGASLFIVISESVVRSYGFEVDPLRVAANVVMGVGFLGGGMIIFNGDSLSNLTTAAGVWVAAAIGMAVGFGMYGVAIVTTLLVIITFTLMWHIEEYLKKLFGKRKKSIIQHLEE